MRSHVQQCSFCATLLEEQKLIRELPKDTTAAKAITAITQLFVDNHPRRRWLQLRRLLSFSSLSEAPWWLVSAGLHLLLILLAGLISLVVTAPQEPHAVIMVTELRARPEANAPELSPADAIPDDPLVSKALQDYVKELPVEILERAANVERTEPEDVLEQAPDLRVAQSASEHDLAREFTNASRDADKPGSSASGGGVEGDAAQGLNELIGVGGSAGRGKGNGVFGGEGEGVGAGSGMGGGHASFAFRSGKLRNQLLKKNGGTAATEAAVSQALHWLAYHQEPDGHWNVGKYEGASGTDAGITGLALLAFLGAGNSERTGEYKDNVRRAVCWIVSKQGPDGAIGKGFKEMVQIGHPGFAYHHAICGLALTEAAGLAHIPQTWDAAQRAVFYSTEVAQGGNASQRLAWRYEPKRDADASVTGWYVMQLKSARIAGLFVPPQSLEGALHFYDSIEKKTEVNGYKGGQFPYQRSEPPQLNPTAIGMLCNLFLGRQPGDLLAGAEFLSQNPPRWDNGIGEGVKNYHFPMYYIYYGTLTMFQMGGDYWKKWNDTLQDTLLQHQRKDGDPTGSWDPLGGADDEMGGRTYMTALGALSLEVYYRYLMLHGK